MDGLTIDKVRDHDSDRDHDLKHAGNPATSVFWGAFGYIRRCNGGYSADANARYDASAVDVADATTTPGHRSQDLRESVGKFTVRASKLTAPTQNRTVKPTRVRLRPTKAARHERG